MLGETLAVMMFGLGHDCGLQNQFFARFDNEKGDFFCEVLWSVLAYTKVYLVELITMKISTLLEISAHEHGSFRTSA